MLGIGAVAVPQADVFAVIGFRQGQIQAFVRVGLHFDRAAVKSELLGRMILAFGQLDIGTVGGVALVQARQQGAVFVLVGEARRIGHSSRWEGQDKSEAEKFKFKNLNIIGKWLFCSFMI